MSTDDYLTVEHSPSGVTTITLTHGKVNALCVGLLEQLRSVAIELSADPATRCVVITGGPRVFAAGADITEFASDPSPETFEIADPLDVARVGESFLTALEAVAALSVPTIASVSGFALGGGCELALACDLRVASTAAVFGQPEILLGIIPGGGGTQRLARLVGVGIAKDLVFTGRQVRAEEALAIGLVNRVVEPDELDAATSTLAGSLAAGATHALRLAKQAIDDGLDEPLADGLRTEQRAFVESFATPDASRGVASFLATGPGNADFHPDDS